MKKRQIKKTSSDDYFIWVRHEESNQYIPLPRSPRCWHLMRRAVCKIGAREMLEEYEQKFKRIASLHSI